LGGRFLLESNSRTGTTLSVSVPADPAPDQ
jgi:hypothetical protein